MIRMPNCVIANVFLDGKQQRKPPEILDGDVALT
jgi:hypothetical protein